LSLRARLSRELGREIGVYPETKHPTYFRATAKLPLEEPLVEALRRNGLDKKKAPVFVQSFETDNLKLLNRVLKVPIVQLLSASGTPFDLAGTPKSYAFLSSPAGLDEIAEYADAIGPAKDQIVPRAPAGSTSPPAGSSLPPTTLVADAHAAGLLVHPYTFRAENVFLPLELRSSADPGRLRQPVRRDRAALPARGRRRVHRQPGLRPRGPRRRRGVARAASRGDEPAGSRLGRSGGRAGKRQFCTVGDAEPRRCAGCSP